jgi:hypothetical protein
VEARFVSDFFDWFDSVTEPANLNWAVAGPSSPNALRGFRIVPGSSRLQVSLPSGSTWIPDSSLLTLDDVRRQSVHFGHRYHFCMTLMCIISSPSLYLCKLWFF